MLWAREARELLHLGSPVIVTQVCMMALGVVDAIMVGRIGVEPLAAAALANVWVMGTMLAAMGVVLGMDPIVSQAHGAKDGARLGLALQQGLAIAALVSVPTALALVFTEQGLLLLGQNPALAHEAHRYALVQIPGVLPFLLFVALRQYLQGRRLVAPAMWVAFVANFLNAGMNWLLIYGNWGFPRLELVGSSWATTATRWFFFVALVAWILVRRLHHGAWIPWTRAALHPARLAEILRFGIPVALQFGLEVWAFQISTLMAGRLGAEALAGHTIVLNLASLSFMVPLGISIGAAIRVGNLIGARDPRGAQRAAWVAFILGALAMGLFAIVFFVLRDELPHVYTSDATVIAIGAALLPIAAGFQLFDGLQVVGCAILRGMGRTLPAAAFNLLAYYALAIPIAWMLAFRMGVGVAGVWWGLLIGLGAAASLLVLWVWRRGPARVDARVV